MLMTAAYKLNVLAVQVVEEAQQLHKKENEPINYQNLAQTDVSTREVGTEWQAITFVKVAFLENGVDSLSLHMNSLGYDGCCSSITPFILINLILILF